MGAVRHGIQFEWDPEKARINKQVHHVTFEQSIDAFFDDGGVVLEDVTTEDGEERLHLIGATRTTTLLLVVHTYRNESGGASIRIISARKATPRERGIYEDSNS